MRLRQFQPSPRKRLLYLKRAHEPSPKRPTHPKHRNALMEEAHPMSTSHCKEVPLVCQCGCKLFTCTFITSNYLQTECFQCCDRCLLAMPVESAGPRLVEKPPEAGGLLTLSIKGTGEEAILAGEQHGVSITVTHEVRRPKGNGYCEGLASSAYSSEIQRWYAGQDHSRPYMPGALLWWRPAESKEEVTR
jgi:hypothetical protein